VTGDEWAVEIECIPGEVLFLNGEALRAPGFASPEEKLGFILRQVCHFLINRIDARGLQDVCQSLAEFYQYYRPVEEPRKLLPESRTLDASIGARSIRPAFVIEEE
jgi:hypothetical protein